MTKEEHAQYKWQIKNGFLTSELEPIKCVECDSEEMKDTTLAEDGGYVSEFQRDCKKCGAGLGTWAYGNWQI